MKAKKHLVILSGHSSGLGLSLLRLCLQDGAHVLGFSRRQLNLQNPRLQQVSLDLGQHRPDFPQRLQAYAHFLDAEAWEQVTLVNNAGSATPFGFLGELEAEQVERSLQLNVTGPLLLTNWFLQRFPSSKLSVVMISSGASHKAYPGWSPYCSSKAALRMAAQVVAQEAELRGSDRRVLIYEPGVLDTAMQAQVQATDPSVFPQGDRFRDLKSRGQLVSPDASAQELWALILNKDLPKLYETRYGAQR